MNCDQSSENNMIPNTDVSSKCTAIRKNTIISDKAIVCNVAIGHNETITSYFGHLSIGSALLMVTHSRMVVLSPITARVSSPLNFRSCGTAAITDPGKILQFLPILAPSIMVTFDPIQVPSPISTLLSIEVNGSITTFFATCSFRVDVC